MFGQQPLLFLNAFAYVTALLSSRFSRFEANSDKEQTSLAGLPAITEPSGHEPETTAPAPIIEFAPILDPISTMA